MKKHNGIRPQDVVILIQIALLEKESFQMRDLASRLFISPGEVSVSLQRSFYSGLIADDKQTVNRDTLLKFIIYGLPFVFPVKPSSPIMGIPTGHSAYPLNIIFDDSEIFVWACSEGTARGLAIEPYYKNQPKAVLQNSYLYAVLALTDSIRLGRKREKNKAAEMLEQVLINRKTIDELL
jgi:hypothetical protein